MLTHARSTSRSATPPHAPTGRTAATTYAGHVFRRWLISVLAAALTFAGAAFVISIIKGDRPPTHRVQPGNLIVIGMPGLTWSDINEDTMPNVASMAQHGAVGNQLVRAISPHSCSDAAWVTLGAGTRTPMGYGPPMAAASGTNSFCPPPVTGRYDAATHTYSYPQWATWSKAAPTRNIPSRMGLVASTLEKNGQCVAAVGERATLGAANRQGVVSHYSPTLADADLGACPVTFVSLPTRNDMQLRYVIDHAPIDTTFLVTGLTDDERPESPRAVILDGPNVGGGMLRSRSTRQPGLVTTTDLSAFILERVPHPPVLGEGRPLSIERTATPPALRSVNNMQTLLRTEHNLVAPFFTWVGVIGGILTLIGLALFAWVRAGARALEGRRRRWDAWWGAAKPVTAAAVTRRRAINRWWWSVSAALLASVPVATFLANLYAWYLPEHALVRFGLAVAAVIVPMTLAAFAGPWRSWTPGPAVFIAAFTALTLAMDVVQGSRLQLVSMMGLQPVYGGRFFGMGNVGYALFMTSALFVAAMLAGRYRAMKRPRLALLTVLAIGVPAILVNGVPQWGNEGGGSAAFVPALIYLAMRARGWRITFTRLLIAGVSGVVFVFGVAWLDYLRGETARTHLGDVFAGLIGDGRANPFKRILYTNWNMLNQHWFYWLVPVGLALAVLVTAFPTGPGRFLQPLFVRVPMLRHGLIAIIIMLGFGFIANDSGTSIPPAGALVIVPLLVMTAARLTSPSTHEGPHVPEAGRLPSGS